MSTAIVPTIELWNGHSMPLVGLGTWQASDESELEKSLRAALDAGYRHIDTAFAYRNEQFIGNTLKNIFAEGKIKRSDLFIVTKLPPTGMAEKYVEHYLRKSLSALQLDYVDLYLVHCPFYAEKKADDLDIFPLENGVFARGPDMDLRSTWHAMETMVDKGLTKSIGLSNFNRKQIQRILDSARIKPAVLQVECHVFLPQYELHDFCKKNEISMTAYSPLGTPGLPDYFKERFKVDVDVPNLLGDPKIKSLAQKYNKTPAQILLRYLVQRDIVVIPKSSNPDRIKQNIDIYDFVLSDEDMGVLKSMGAVKNRICKFDMIPGLLEHPEYPFNEPF